MRTVVFMIGIGILSLAISASCQQDSGSSNAQRASAAQQQSPTQNNPSPLSTPSITGPLQADPPITFEAGPIGILNLNGVLSGFGFVQNNHVSGDSTGQAALSNAQVFVQKADGWWQFYVQAGAYNIQPLGLPFLPTGKQVENLYGPVPVAYLKLAPAKNTSIQIGELPTLMGQEYTFDFQT